MAEQLSIRLNRSLMTPHQGVRVLTFPVEIVGNAFAGDGWRRRCRIEGHLDESGQPLGRDFLPSGQASLSLPADVAGEVTLVFELHNPRTGRRLTGDISLRVDRREAAGNYQVLAGGHHVEGSGVVYQPIEIHATGGERVEVAGDKLRFEIELFEEDAAGAVAAEDLAEREELILLPDRGDGILRVLALDFGPDLVLGRCYVSQLREQAKARLVQLGLDRVHWVTCWDDPDLNQLSARLHFRRGPTDSLSLHNATDYSQRRQRVAALSAGESELVAAPGGQIDLPLPSEHCVEIVVGEGTRRRSLARLEMDETMIGGTPVPVFRSAGTSFRSPPGGGPEAVTVHFLGVWIPWPIKLLAQLLEAAKSPLSVTFDRDEVYLWLQYRRDQRMLAASSNIDLRSCLAMR